MEIFFRITLVLFICSVIALGILQNIKEINRRNYIEGTLKHIRVLIRR